ncbi:MAG: SDR family oxidoreductase [Candidatus Bathyarchaeia archaeon]|nr:SDR family oxidoreductase [Candidatus Bathyarchaeota archaeon]
MKLKGKVAIVTGGTRGIGFAVASRFAREGAKVVIIGLHEEGVREAERKIRDQGGEVLGFQGDVSSRERMAEIISQVLERFGTIDILVNNAGIHAGRSFWEEPLEFYERMFRVNVLGTVIPSQLVVPHMIEKRGGKIINISSKAAIVGEPGHAAYSSSKGAILSLTRAMAIELAQYNINVNAICPGPTETAMVLEPMTEEHLKQLEELKKEIPLRRLGKPEDIAGAALYLASDDSDWCTGQAVVVDGGMSILK